MLIGELFMTLPSDTVLALLSLDITEAANLKSVVSHFKSQKYTGIFEIYTWPTLSSHLLSLAKNEPNGFLSAKLCDERELQFVTNYFNQVCLSPNVSHDWVNAVDCCPRVVQLFSLISDLKKLLIVDSEPSAIVSTIRKWIQDNGDSDFVHPITSELACGAKEKIKTFLSLESVGSKMLKLENVTFDALCTHEKEFMEDEFDLDSEMKVCTDNSLTFLFTKKKRIPVVITRSFFMMVADKEPTKEVRLKALHSYYGCLQLLDSIGLSDPTEVNVMVARLLTFGMTLCGLDDEYKGSYHLARNNLFPAKYFLGAMKDTMTVTKCLGLTVNDTLFIYHTLGENAFNLVLKAYKLQTPSPLSPAWKCTGIPGYIDCLDYSGRRYQTSRVGSIGKEWHPFFGYFLCHICHRKVGWAELKYYESNKNDLCANQKKRMQELITQKNDNKMKWSQNECIRKDTRYKDGTHREFLEKRYAQAKARGETKKTKLEHRYDESRTKFYKNTTKERMVEALHISRFKSPSRHIYNNFLVDVCDKVLEKEGEMGNEVIKWTPKEGLLVCLRHEYNIIANWAENNVPHCELVLISSPVLVQKNVLAMDFRGNFGLLVAALCNRSIVGTY